MIIKVLVENTSSSDEFGFEHGLSLFIETENHNLLFDTGGSALFYDNAVKMGIDLTKVDMVVISHGHYDHGGGLETFLKINDNAKIYLHRKAFEKHIGNRADGRKEYIGLDERLLPNDRFVFCDDLKIDKELELFSRVKQERFVPSGNADLLVKLGEEHFLDDFSHEQNLIINENGKTLLISGCAHNGIVNILGKYQELKGGTPDYVIGGFHLTNPGKNEDEKPSVVTEIGEILLNTKTQYFTCHCTGMTSYKHLKAVLGDKIDYLSVGQGLVL